MPYVGRFAPSPTGPLHIGSLTTAVASYLHAKKANGEWLLRIDDIDQPREKKGAADSIRKTLNAFQLEWDRDVFYQSSDMEKYHEVAEKLVTFGHAFRCSCTRKELQKTGKRNVLGIKYPGECRTRINHYKPTAIRVLVESDELIFIDALQGKQINNLSHLTGDYIIIRSDKLPSYNLSTVLDDSYQGVTHIVRGIDLLELTSIHIHLQRILGIKTPNYLHLPIIVNANDQKLSKQTGAPAITSTSVNKTALIILSYLGLQTPNELMGSTPSELWAWAIQNWDPNNLANQRTIKTLQV
ncbi:MAG: tRNA glutamyl-Q(34) synthetase GluQRS [Gammaproteobacteria bacterium]|nr:tRNA glutamyl-Q(34) synthetase GluQRS [Gammaproteobacteria bacterium]